MVTAALVAAALAGCAAKQPPAAGEVMVALVTDMSIPKDVTTIHIEVLVGGLLTYEDDYPIAPDGDYHLPGTLAVVAGDKVSPTVEVHVVGIRTKADGTSEARTFGRVATTVPKSRIATLRVPIHWLCDGSALVVGDHTYDTTCPPQDGVPTSCVAGTCQPYAADEGTLPDYSPPLIYGGGSGEVNDPLGQCFDTVSCLAPGTDVLPDSECTLTLPSDSRPLNVGLRFLPGGDGICDDSKPGTPCYIPLDQDDALGWSMLGDGRVKLPPAVCDRLAAGRFASVRVSHGCETKTPEYPTCGKWSSVGSVISAVPGSGSGGAASVDGGVGAGGALGSTGQAGASSGSFGASSSGGAGSSTAGTTGMGEGGAAFSTGGTPGTSGGTGTGASAGSANTAGGASSGGKSGVAGAGSGTAGASTAGAGGGTSASCPGAAPTTGGVCSIGNASCYYAGQLCRCMASAWACQSSSAGCPTAQPATGDACTNGLQCFYPGHSCVCSNTKFACF